ncbi:D-alanine--poly(phosphoribitol) ligase [Amycolatopsis rubida]|uniref:Amino acid adenylation domain-containing protein n=1 Tax=Amycolatopsis rubida TaxID=112413 RepID=A0A1I5I6W0_9PSEU|nr:MULTISPECIES: AMP-binding protein [Amycolatopsis]MYW96724.1 AMP-binding protein [Amycolatopsis rubida]NEC61709.1 D-alanine--poly(phosphoribitol) ligase [Amycolatopsis rubida]OAP25804.1 Surfactin synthase subunit 1 [Amycolatopsis sp. M39]SFO56388.1 amino acid adenylation domain-containing protein [Amycolatopsis rubida]
MDTTTTSGLHARFLRGLARSESRPAVSVGGQTLTYGELHERALLWGGALAESGARTVGVLAGKGVTAYAGILAGLYAGATVVPLRPDFPAARTAQMVEAAEADAIIADERGLTVAPPVKTLLAPEVGQPGLWQPKTALSEPVDVRPEDSAYILFTSGSTGRPKGVRIGHGSTEHYFGLLDARYDFTPDDVFSQTFDLNFDCAMFDLFCAWGAGAEAVVLPGAAYRNVPAFVEERGLTVWFSTPSAIDLVRRTGRLTPDAMPGLRWSFFAGEALTVRDTADWRAAAGNSVTENLYGPTELTITVAGYRWDDEETPRIAVNGVVPIGAVHQGHEYLLIDENEAGEGELAIAGPQLTPGYLDPADEKGRFLDRDGRRFYRTGDRVRRLGGDDLAYLGRLDSQVQVLGWRVELTEVEHALQACGVQAVALGVQGDGGTELFVFYTGPRRPVIELVRALRAVLPEGVIPRRYEHVEEFPLNSNRKIDRKTLAARAVELLSPVPA